MTTIVELERETTARRGAEVELACTKARLEVARAQRHGAEAQLRYSERLREAGRDRVAHLEDELDRVKGERTAAWDQLREARRLTEAMRGQRNQAQQRVAIVEDANRGLAEGNDVLVARVRELKGDLAESRNGRAVDVEALTHQRDQALQQLDQVRDLVRAVMRSAAPLVAAVVRNYRAVAGER